METASNKNVSNQVIDGDELAATLNKEKALRDQNTTEVDLDPFIIVQCKLVEEQLVQQKSGIDRIAACIQAYKQSQDDSTT